MEMTFMKKCFLFTVGSVSHKAVHNWVEKFSQGRSKVARDVRPGRPVETATEATVQRVEDLIRANSRITIDSVNNCTRMFPWFNIQNNT
jgi:hypothetical protein